MQDKEQKKDLALACKGFKNYKNLDYISCWFILGSKYIFGYNAKLAFVSTNSICQGEQVAMLWSHILEKNVEIGFAHTSFKWINNAKGNAGVTVIIVGLRNISKERKHLFVDGMAQEVKNINSYLANARDIIVEKRTTPISELPKMTYGNKAVDGGNLILLNNEKEKIINSYSDSEEFFRKLIGSSEFIKGSWRWCLWISDENLEKAISIPNIEERIERTRKCRLSSKDLGAQDLAKRAHQFRDFYTGNKESIIIPRVSSERREYIPCGFLTADTVILDSAQAIYDAEPWIFAVISSKMHMTWVRAVAGRLKTDYRYSSALCYNTFPIPPLTTKQKEELTRYVYEILGEREKHSEKTMAQLYDPDKMPADLLDAHHRMDAAVERIYRSKPFASDEERLEYLFALYEKMVEEEKMKK